MGEVPAKPTPLPSGGCMRKTEPQPERHLSISIPAKLHHKMKVRCAEAGMTVKGFIARAVERELGRK